VHGLLFETNVSGKKLDDYLHDVKENRNNPTHQQKMEQAKIAFSSVGRALAELNLSKAEKVDFNHPIPQKFLKDLQGRIIKSISSDAAKILEEKYQLDFSKVKTLVEKLSEAICKQPFIIGYQHGDTKIGNFFYNDEKNKVSLIDLHRLH